MRVARDPRDGQALTLGDLIARLIAVTCVDDIADVAGDDPGGPRAPTTRRSRASCRASTAWRTSAGTAGRCRASATPSPTIPRPSTCCARAPPVRSSSAIRRPIPPRCPCSSGRDTRRCSWCRWCSAAGTSACSSSTVATRCRGTAREIERAQLLAHQLAAVIDLLARESSRAAPDPPAVATTRRWRSSSTSCASTRASTLPFTVLVPHDDRRLRSRSCTSSRPGSACAAPGSIATTTTCRRMAAPRRSRSGPRRSRPASCCSGWPARAASAPAAAARRAGEGTRTPGLRFTKPLLYQLSYSGGRHAV